jgi:membrane protein YqaA with SNARE-associated domain
LAELSAYLSLFLVALGAATVMPVLTSEPVVVAMILSGSYEPVTVWLVASLGTTSGAAINWCLARYALHFQDRPWFPVRPEQLKRAAGWFQRYGSWSLLFSWLPVVGDPLTFAAGLLRVSFAWFLVLVASGKAARYAVLIWLTLRGTESWSG